MTDGVKYDIGKTRYGLVPPLALKEVADVMTYGAKKYAPDNWRYVDQAKNRYFDALMRHAWDWRMGSTKDKETALHELAHAACCALFIIELELLEEKEHQK